MERQWQLGLRYGHDFRREPNFRESRGITSDSALVLGDNNTAFVTDGTNVVSFNPTNLQQNWAYTSTSGGTLNFVAATSGAGVTINDSQLGVIQLDSTGNPSTPQASLQGAQYFGNSLWLGVTGDPALAEIQGNLLNWAASAFAMPAGNVENRGARFELGLEWCLQGSCPNFGDQPISFSSSSVNRPHPTITFNSAQVSSIQMTALKAFASAFAAYPAVQVSLGHQRSHTVLVVGENGGPGICGATAPIVTTLSRVYFVENATQAQFALGFQTPTPTSQQVNLLAQMIGEGIGNNAAHEIAHQLSNAGQFVAGLDDNSSDTYNEATCDGSDASWLYNGSFKGTAIHWGTNAASSLQSIFGN